MPILTALVLLLFAAPAAAQTVAVAVDRLAVPDLGAEVPIPHDLDGDPWTSDFVQGRYVDGGVYELRSVIARDGRICLGIWIRPFAIATASAVPGDLLLLGATFPAVIGRFVVIGIRGYYEVTIPFGC